MPGTSSSTGDVFIDDILKQNQNKTKKDLFSVIPMWCIFRTDAGSSACCDNYEKDENGECNCKIDTLEIYLGTKLHIF